MGTALTGTTPQDTYDSLIKVGDNGPIGATAKYLSDGLGNDSALALSTSQFAIGTTSLFTKASIADSLAATSVGSNYNAGILNIQNTNTTNGNLSLIGFQDANASINLAALGAINTVHSASPNNVVGELGFYTKPSGSAYVTEKMRITSTGNVGIGTSAPNAKLEIVDTTSRAGVTASLIIEGRQDGAANVLTLRAKDFSDPTDAIGPNHGPIMRFQGFDGTDFENMAYIQVAAQGQSVANADAPSFMAFGVSADGSSTPTERMRILSGGGLTFNGDTAQANALDDYEEGTWTMGVSFGGAAVGVTTSVNTGTYTKIGRQVTVNGYIALSNKGSSTGTTSITGLPFSIPNNNANHAAASVWLINISFENQFQAFGAPNSTRIEMFEITEAGSLTFLNDTNFANNSEVVVSLTYFV